MNTAIKAIETEYGGIKFRSRLEARWGMFFDRLNIRWIYEHEGYETPYGPYLPDFWLPDTYLRAKDGKGVLFEVKPAGWKELPPVKKFRYHSLKPADHFQKHGLVNPLLMRRPHTCPVYDHARLQYVAKALNVGAILTKGLFHAPDYTGAGDFEEMIQLASWWDWGMGVMVCRCHTSWFNYASAGYCYECPVCGKDAYDFTAERVAAAQSAVLSYRFWEPK